MTPWRKKLKLYEAKVRAEDAYSEKQIPIVALWRAQESEVQGLNDPDARVQSIIDLTYEWEGTTTTRDEIAVMARSLRLLAKKVLRQDRTRDAFDLGCLWERFRFVTSPDQLAVTNYKKNVSSGKKGGKQKSTNQKPELTKRDEVIIAEAMALLAETPGKEKAHAWALEKTYGGSELDNPVGYDTIRKVHIPEAKLRLKKKNTSI